MSQWCLRAVPGFWRGTCDPGIGRSAEPPRRGSSLLRDQSLTIVHSRDGAPPQVRPRRWDSRYSFLIGSTSPSSWAMAAASVRLATPSLARMFET
jgi:hypothetical protein